MSIIKTTFEKVYPIWNKFLWPDRESKIESHSAMMFLSGYNLKNFDYAPTFFIYTINSDIIAGCNSGHKCCDGSYRSRGLYVFPEYRKKGIGRELLMATVNQGIIENARFVWSYPRQSSWNTYESAGFSLATEWESSEIGINAYCRT